MPHDHRQGDGTLRRDPPGVPASSRPSLALEALHLTLDHWGEPQICWGCALNHADRLVAWAEGGPNPFAEKAVDIPPRG